MRKIGLDTRDLEHPEPLEMSMKVLQSLDMDSYLYMLHRKNPLPLIDLAKENKFQVLSHEDSHENWHILITKNPSEDLSTYLDV